MGLTIALRLARAGHDITVIEAGAQPGGLATWFDYEGFIWDKYYHVFLTQDENLIGLFRDVGIEDKIRWNETRTGFLWKGRHLSMSNNWEFATFPALSLIQKARLALGIFYVQTINDATPLESVKASAWLRKIFGRRVYDVMWEPLLESKYGVLKDEMPATIMWATIRRYFQTRSKGGGKEQMGFLAGGMRTMYQALLAEIEKSGGKVRFGCAVETVDNGADDSVHVVTSDETLQFDRVVSTLPTDVMRRIAPDITEILPKSTGRPHFLGIVMLSLVLRRPLNPYYVTNLIQKGFPFTGIIGVSCLTEAEELGGNHLAMLPRYDVPDSDWFARSDEEIAEMFLEALRPFYPDLDENVQRWFVCREKLVQAIWIDAPPETSEPPISDDGRVWSVNAELAGRDTLNNNAIIGVANRVASDLITSIEG